MNKLAIHSLSKAELEHELAITQERLEKKETQLRRCMQELQGVLTKLDANKNYKAKLLAKEQDLEKAQAKINKLEPRIKELQAKARKLNRQNKSLTEQLTSNELEKEKTHSEAYKSAKKRLAELEKLARTVEQKITALEKGDKTLQHGQQNGKTESVAGQMHMAQHAKKINFQQSDFVIEPGQPLRLWLPFTIRPAHNSSKAFMQYYLEKDNPNYTLQFAFDEDESSEIIAIENTAGELNGH
jgi:chromosome segregation ATPase